MTPLKLVGSYALFLLANARALASRATEVRYEIDRRAWVQ
jgi:hypothetical protein